MKKVFGLGLVLILTACHHGFLPSNIYYDEHVGGYEDFYSHVTIYPAPVIEGRGNPEPSKANSGCFVEGRNVKLSPYTIAKVEVTYKLWKEVYDWAVQKGYSFKSAGWKGSNNNGSETEPVTNISWIDAVVWCNAYTEMKKGLPYCVYKNSKEDSAVLRNANDSTKWHTVYFDQTKTGFRLPTEAEWEYAARWQGKDGSNANGYGYVYLTNLTSASGAKGNSQAETSSVAWSKYTDTGKTMPVGTRKKNALGIYDMSGNVWEYCFDYYEKTPSTGNYTNPVSYSDEKWRVTRGGGWQCVPRNIYVGSRFPCEPDQLAPSKVWGFRIVWSKKS